MRRLRFNMRSMLLATALVAAFFGYGQWRRHAIQCEAKELESHGFELSFSDSWTAWVWPTAPKTAAFQYYQVGIDKCRIASGIYSFDEIDRLYGRACDQLHALGVEEVRLDREGKPGAGGYTSTD